MEGNEPWDLWSQCGHCVAWTQQGGKHRAVHEEGHRREDRRRGENPDPAQRSGHHAEEDAPQAENADVHEQPDHGGQRSRAARIERSVQQSGPADGAEGAHDATVAQTESRERTTRRRRGHHAGEAAEPRALREAHRRIGAPAKAHGGARYVLDTSGKETSWHPPLKGGACPDADGWYVARMSEPSEGAPLILVVEDRVEVADAIRRTLASKGYAVRTAGDGEAGLHMALDLAPDLVILDIHLPKRNGLAVARELRKRAFRAPLMMLTARDTVTDKVAGLEAGADDYLAKPFDYDELLARVKALLRRSSMRADDSLLRVGDVVLDPVAREVTRAGEAVSLTQKELALLEYMMRNAGRTLTREMIAEHVWKSEPGPASNIVDVYVNYLRRKLDGSDASSLFRTIRGVGYVMERHAGAHTRGEG